MKTCPYCSKEIPEDAVQCEFCKRSLVKKTTPTWQISLPAGLILAALILVGNLSIAAYVTPLDALLHFVTNTIIYTLLASLLIAVIRWIYRAITGKESTDQVE